MENNKSITSILESMGDLLNDLTVAADELIEKHKEEKPVAGWYCFEQTPGYLMFIDQVKKINYGFGVSGKWVEKENWNSNFDLSQSGYMCYKLADPKEVEQRLIKEAKRRGFKEGVKLTDTEDLFTRHELEGDFYFNTVNGVIDYNKFCMGASCIMYNGKWAEIIEPLTLNGELVTIKNNNLNWGSNFVDIETAKATLKLKNVTRVRFSFCNDLVLISDLKQLLTKIEENV